MTRKLYGFHKNTPKNTTLKQCLSKSSHSLISTQAETVCLPVADGGEGTLEALGGPNRTSLVIGPLRHRTEAGWRLEGDVAIVEMACASGLLLAGGAEGNDPLAATTAGTGELIAEAVASGARRVIVGVGGSATTDGGLGALDAMSPLARLAGVSVVVACDVRTRFCDAARIFGPQKGASPPQIELLTRRLERLVDLYRERYGIDVGEMPGAGAAGGLAGGLAAGLRAELAPGFDVVRDRDRPARRDRRCRSGHHRRGAARCEFVRRQGRGRRSGNGR